MTAAPEPAHAPPPTCAMCGVAVVPDAPRCPACGMARPAARGRQVFTQQGVWVLVVALVGLYAAALLIVATAR